MLVMILTRNCLELTQRCIASVKAQDIPTEIHVFDNGSTDGSVEWCADNADSVYLAMKNQGVSRGWNTLLHSVFRYSRATHALVINNDVILPPYFYRELLAYDLPFVTGASVDSMEALENRGPSAQAYPGPDFSGFLIRRDCWDHVGQFDEGFVHYCGDCDYHIRASWSGVELLNSGVPFYHERSSTLKNANEEDRQSIQLRAEADRAYFYKKYGCYPWEPAYAELFTPHSTQSSR